MPELEVLFPRAVHHLVELALKAQAEVVSVVASVVGASKVPVEHVSQSVRKIDEHQAILLKAAGIHARRPHLEQIVDKVTQDKNWQGEISLPGGWVLRREVSRRALRKLVSGGKLPKERWMLERF